MFAAPDILHISEEIQKSELENNYMLDFSALKQRNKVNSKILCPPPLVDEKNESWERRMWVFQPLTAAEPLWNQQVISQNRQKT